MREALKRIQGRIDKCIKDLEEHEDNPAIRDVIITRLHMEAQREQEALVFLDKTAGKSVLMGHVDVDSGCIMIVDPCYVRHDREYDANFNRYVVHADKSWGSEEDYNTATDAAILFSRNPDEGTAQFRVKGAATAVAHSIGDWSWPVYANYNDDGELLSIELKVREE